MYLLCLLRVFEGVSVYPTKTTISNRTSITEKIGYFFDIFNLFLDRVLLMLKKSVINISIWIETLFCNFASCINLSQRFFFPKRKYLFPILTGPFKTLAGSHVKRSIVLFVKILSEMQYNNNINNLHDGQDNKKGD